MRNIELKARLRDPARAINISQQLHARAQGDIHQIDTYFHVPSGRLKLREAMPGRCELVFYKRPDVSGPKGCDYTLESVAPSIKPMLAAALGVIAVVDKVRTLNLWENVRIHIDAVVGLGAFLEFEAVLDETHDDADGEQKLHYLVQQFDLAPEDHLAESYLDMMIAGAT